MGVYPAKVLLPITNGKAIMHIRRRVTPHPEQFGWEHAHRLKQLESFVTPGRSSVIYYGDVVNWPVVNQNLLCNNPARHYGSTYITVGRLHSAPARD
jgi:hypothetical protein